MFEYHILELEALVQDNDNLLEFLNLRPIFLKDLGKELHGVVNHQVNHQVYTFAYINYGTQTQLAKETKKKRARGGRWYEVVQKDIVALNEAGWVIYDTIMLECTKGEHDDVDMI